jgi:hypothetical protein
MKSLSMSITCFIAVVGLVVLAILSAGCNPLDPGTPPPPSRPTALPSLLPIELTVTLTGEITVKDTAVYTANHIAELSPGRSYSVSPGQDELLVIISHNQKPLESYYLVHSGPGEFVVIVNQKSEINLKDRVAHIDANELSIIQFGRVDGVVEIPTAINATPTSTATPTSLTDSLLAGIISLIPTSTSTTPLSKATRTATATVTPTEEHAIGETWDYEGLSLNLIAIELRPNDSDGDAAVKCRFRMINKTGVKKRIGYNFRAISLMDSMGKQYVDYNGGDPNSRELEPSELWEFDREYSWQPKTWSRVPGDVDWLRIEVKDFARISSAIWRIDLNGLGANAKLRTDGAKGLGQSFQLNGFDITMTGIDVKDKDENIAISYKVENKSNRGQKFTLDTEHLYVLDNFGQRYFDLDGHMVIQFLDADNKADSFVFERNYALMVGMRRGVPPQATFLLVRLDCSQTPQCPQWKYELTR